MPSAAAREKWASHVGAAEEAARLPSRLGFFSGLRAPPSVSLEIVLKAFGFSSRAAAEELGKRAVLARAEALARRSRADPMVEAGEFGWRYSGGGVPLSPGQNYEQV